MALKIKTREEAIAVLRDMVRRKKEMEAKAQIDLLKHERRLETVMHAFNLTRLNFHSPYKVWIDNGSYKFLTDYGVQYQIEFVENDKSGRIKKRMNSAFSMKTRRILLTILKLKQLYNVL